MDIIRFRFTGRQSVSAVFLALPGQSRPVGRRRSDRGRKRGKTTPDQRGTGGPAPLIGPAPAPGSRTPGKLAPRRLPRGTRPPAPATTWVAAHAAASLAVERGIGGKPLLGGWPLAVPATSQQSKLLAWVLLRGCAGCDKSFVFRGLTCANPKCAGLRGCAGCRGPAHLRRPAQKRLAQAKCFSTK